LRGGEKDKAGSPAKTPWRSVVFHEEAPNSNLDR
jgi:hypothetical protein